VRCLVGMSDSSLCSYLLPLTQVLKLEQLQTSDLATFLMYRALTSPYSVGQALYGLLRAEMHEARFFVNCGLFLRQYLEHSALGGHRMELLRAEGLVQQLRKVARHVIDTPDSRRLKVLRDDLALVEFGGDSIRLPVKSSFGVRGINVDKCKYMDSAKKPLWLNFQNADPAGDNILVIFKDGDDVRQDMVVLQMLQVMQNLWSNANIDIPMTPYQVSRLNGCFVKCFIGCYSVRSQRLLCACSTAALRLSTPAMCRLLNG